MRGAIKALLPDNPRHPQVKRDDRPKGLNVLGTLAHHPQLTTAYHTFNGHLLYNTSLTPRQRELLILRVAHVRDCEYEWAQHVVMATDLGVSAAEIERIRDGGDAAGWSALEAAMLRSVDELLADARIGDSTWTQLTAELSTQNVMDLIFTVGAYDVLAMALRSFGTQLDDDLRK
jgi:AhpD family alkylhydroperoxidase